MVPASLALFLISTKEIIQERYNIYMRCKISSEQKSTLKEYVWASMRENEQHSTRFRVVVLYDLKAQGIFESKVSLNIKGDVVQGAA